MAKSATPPADRKASRIDTKRPAQKRARPRTGPPFSIENQDWLLDISAGIASSIAPNKGGVRMMPTDEVIRRAGSYRVYNEMLTDDMVKLCLNLKKILVYGRTSDIKPADDSDQAKQIADYVEWALCRIDFKSLLREALTALEFGYSAGEIGWEVTRYEGELRVALKDVKFRDPMYIEIICNQFGDIELFRQKHFGMIDITPDKVFHFAHQPLFSNPYGTSDLRAAYRGWWAKKFIVNFWNVYLERLGSPITMMKYPKGASQPLKDALKEILQGLSQKGELLVPEGVVVELLEAKRAGNATYGDALHFHNNSIAHATLMIGMIGADTESARSADSQAHIQLRTTFKMADEVSRALLHVVQKKLIEPMVDFNFEHDGLYPTLVLQDYGEYEATLIADSIRQLFMAGFIDPDQQDINYVRSIVGMPIRKEGDAEDEVIRPDPLPPSGTGAPPPAAPQGNSRGGTKGGGTRKTDPTSSRNRKTT